MPKTSEGDSPEKGNNLRLEITLTVSQLAKFQKVFKSGIYKELYERNLITGSQLTCLLDRIGSWEGDR